MHMQPTWQRSFSAEVTKLYRSGPQRTTKWLLKDHRAVTKLSQSLCTKAVHGWFRVHVSGVGGGSRWGIFKSGLGLVVMTPGGWGIYKSGLELVVMMLGGWGIYKSGLQGRLEAVEH